MTKVSATVKITTPVKRTCPTNSATHENHVFVTPVKSIPIDETGEGKVILPSPVARKRTLDVSLATHFAAKRLKNDSKPALAEEEDDIDLDADSSGEDYDSDELVYEDSEGDDKDSSNGPGEDEYDHQDKFFDWE
jgi:hypothetical protein